MFMVFLNLTANKAAASQHMDAHNAWIQQGLDDGVFLAVGNQAFGAGGAILAHGLEPDELRQRLNDDPFVAEGIVDVDLHQITPKRTDPRLDFLLQ